MIHCRKQVLQAGLEEAKAVGVSRHAKWCEGGRRSWVVMKVLPSLCLILAEHEMLKPLRDILCSENGWMQERWPQLDEIRKSLFVKMELLWKFLQVTARDWPLVDIKHRPIGRIVSP